MARNLSVVARRALYAQETDVGFPVLLTIEHTTFEEPLRFTNWDDRIPSRGNFYVSYPFNITFPTDSVDRPPRAQLSVDNVDRQIVAALRALKTRPTVTIEIVTTVNPDLVEASFSGFELKDVTYDKLVVSGSLEPETFLREPYPHRRFTPGAFRGIF